MGIGVIFCSDIDDCCLGWWEKWLGMYKYTAKDGIKKAMMGRWAHMPDYEKCRDLLKGYGVTDYLSTGHFMLWYPGVEFYSKGRRDSIPVNGFLLPVDLFDEEVIS